MKSIVSAILLIGFASPALADGLLPEKAPQVMEIKMPDGTKQKGFVKDGVFVPIVDTAKAETQKIEAQVKQIVTSMDEDTAASLISVETTLLPLDSKLKKRYSAYKITVTSNYPKSLRVVSGNVSNAIDGPLAYQIVKGSASKSLFGLLVPFAWIVVTPVSAGVIHNRNKKAEGEAVLYPGQVPMIDHISKGENFQFSALVPLGQKPQVRVAFKDSDNFEFVKSAQ